MKTIATILAFVLLSAAYTVYSIGRIEIVTPAHFFTKQSDVDPR